MQRLHNFTESTLIETRFACDSGKKGIVKIRPFLDVALKRLRVEVESPTIITVEYICMCVLEETYLALFEV